MGGELWWEGLSGSHSWAGFQRASKSLEGAMTVTRMGHSLPADKASQTKCNSSRLRKGRKQHNRSSERLSLSLMIQSFPLPLFFANGSPTCLYDRERPFHLRKSTSPKG